MKLKIEKKKKPNNMQASSISKVDQSRTGAAIEFVNALQSLNDQRPAEGPWASISLAVGFDRDQLEASTLKEAWKECSQLHELVCKVTTVLPSFL